MVKLTKERKKEGNKERKRIRGQAEKPEQDVGFFDVLRYQNTTGLQ